MKPSLIIMLCNLCIPVCPLVLGQLTLEHYTMSSYPDFAPFSSQSSMRLSQSTFVSTSPLNISSTGDGTIDEVRLDLGEIVIAPYRPRISMRKPLILGSQSAIVLGLGDDIPQMQIENIGPDGSHGMKFSYGMDLPASITFNAIYDVYLGKKTTVLSDNVQSLMKSQTFDKATPKLLEKISSGNTGVNSFFDITYDLQTLTEIRRVTDLSEDVTKITSYDKSTPKLSERISSGNMGVNSFFDIEYDIQALTATSKGGDLVESVIFTRTYDKATPKLLEKISSGNVGATSFFDITWDLSQPSRPLHELAFIGEGLVPMRKQTDCEILTRIINERYNDEANLSHTIEHRMTPDPITGTSMWALLDGGMESSFLRINGGGAPFSVVNTGNVLSNGNMDIAGVVNITGELHVMGIKMFKIDHPLDPENKYLLHSCVESPDMMNIYNGNVLTDANGYAQITLPNYFEALNVDFRYQLTCIGEFAQVIIAEKIMNNQFAIRTDKPNIEVSWQVTGVRHDPIALMYKSPVEMMKN